MLCNTGLAHLSASDLRSVKNLADQTGDEYALDRRCLSILNIDLKYQLLKVRESPKCTMILMLDVKELLS